jgi:hypothetical protein
MPKQAKADPDDLVEVRVLIDCSVGECNALAKVRVGDLDALLAAGAVDDDPAAVAYVKGISL